MLDILCDFIFYLCCFTVAFAIYCVVRRFLTLRKDHMILKLLAGAAFAIAGNVAIFPEEVTGALSTLIFLLLAVLLLYKDNLIVKLSTVIILFPVSTAISYITEDLGFITWYYLFNTALPPVWERILGILTLLLRIFCWYLIYRFTRNWISQVSRDLTVRMWLVIDAISITSCVSIITIIYKSSILGSYVAYPACIACIFTSLGCCYLCSYISKTLKAELEIQALKYQQSYYEELEQNQDTIRKLRHDMKNHLNIIETFLRDGDIPKAKDYFSGLSDEFSFSTRPFCKNNIINAVLNAKYNLAVQEGIDCSFKLDLDEDVPLDDISLCSLFANTLDNAIEACAKIPPQMSRWISLSARCRNGHMSYELSNAKTNDIRMDKNQIITDKKDSASHGIGLSNIRGIVQKYNGHLNIDHAEKHFTITILI